MFNSRVKPQILLWDSFINNYPRRKRNLNLILWGERLKNGEEESLKRKEKKGVSIGVKEQLLTSLHSYGFYRSMFNTREICGAGVFESIGKIQHK